jgi:hypothetical protein
LFLAARDEWLAAIRPKLKIPSLYPTVWMKYTDSVINVLSHSTRSSFADKQFYADLPGLIIILSLQYLIMTVLSK